MNTQIMSINRFADYDFACKQINDLYDLIVNSGSNKVNDISEIVNMGFQFLLNGTYVIIEWNEKLLTAIIKMSDPDGVILTKKDSFKNEVSLFPFTFTPDQSSELVGMTRFYFPLGHGPYSKLKEMIN